MLIAACFVAVSFASAQNPDIKGTWKMLTDAGKNVPAGYTGLKFITDTHFLLMLADGEGNVIAGVGGTYTLDGNLYSESFDYVFPEFKRFQGEKPVLKVTVEGGRMTIEGKLQDEPYLQTWERIK
jgi:hypothetical protein